MGVSGIVPGKIKERPGTMSRKMGYEVKNHIRGQSKHGLCIRWIGKVLGANPVRVFMSGDLGGKQSHAFPLKTIKMHTIQIKTQYFFKISLPYALKLIKYQVSIVISKFMEINLSKTLQNCCK